MTPAELLIEAVSRVPEVFGEATAGFDENRLATPLETGANSIAWLAWHSARCQDAQIADLAGDEELWTAAGWRERFDLPLDASRLGHAEMGYGMSADDAAAVTAPAELLTGYLQAATERTRAYLGGISPEDLDEVIDENWDPPVTRGVRLVSIVDDCVQHAGQAAFIRGILDRA